MDIAKLGVLVAGWAALQPIVTRTHLYGSRVRGSHTSDSDLDVAIEIVQMPGDNSVLDTWIAQKAHLAGSLAKLLPVKLDLEWYGGATETPTIHRSLSEGAIVVYERVA